MTQNSCMGIRVKIRNIEKKTREKNVIFRYLAAGTGGFAGTIGFALSVKYFFGFVLYFRKIIFFFYQTYFSTEGLRSERSVVVSPLVLWLLRILRASLTFLGTEVGGCGGAEVGIEAGPAR